MPEYHLRDWVFDIAKKVKLQEKYSRNGDFSALAPDDEEIETIVFSAEKDRPTFNQKEDSKQNVCINGQPLDKEYNLDVNTELEKQEKLIEAATDAYGAVRQANEKSIADIGRNYWSANYSKDSPIKLLCESNMKTILKNAFQVILHTQAREEAIQFFHSYMGLPEDASKTQKVKSAMEMLKTAFDMILEKQNAKEIIAVEKQIPILEDFDSKRMDQSTNYAYSDFLKKNHSRSKRKVELFGDNQNDKNSYKDEPVACSGEEEWHLKKKGERPDPFDHVNLGLTYEAFIQSLSSDEQELLQMLRAGISKTEIAKHFGITPPAITKRVKSLQDKFNAWRSENE